MTSKSMVKVNNVARDGRIMTGIGFLISEKHRLILTCKHVITQEEGSSLTVSFGDANCKARVIASDWCEEFKVDLAVIQAKSSFEGQSELSLSFTSVQQSVDGYVLEGIRGERIPGKTNGIDFLITNNGGHQLRVGDSGNLVFDLSCNIVGMIYQTERTNRAFLISSEEIEQFLLFNFTPPLLFGSNSALSNGKAIEQLRIDNATTKKRLLILVFFFCITSIYFLVKQSTTDRYQQQSASILEYQKNNTWPFVKTSRLKRELEVYVNKTNFERKLQSYVSQREFKAGLKSCIDEEQLNVSLSSLISQTKLDEQLSLLNRKHRLSIFYQTFPSGSEKLNFDLKGDNRWALRNLTKHSYKGERSGSTLKDGKIQITASGTYLIKALAPAHGMYYSQTRVVLRKNGELKELALGTIAADYQRSTNSATHSFLTCIATIQQGGEISFEQRYVSESANHSMGIAPNHTFFEKDTKNAPYPALNVIVEIEKLE